MTATAVMDTPDATTTATDHATRSVGIWFQTIPRAPVEQAHKYVLPESDSDSGADDKESPSEQLQRAMVVELLEWLAKQRVAIR